MNACADIVAMPGNPAGNIIATAQMGLVVRAGGVYQAGTSRQAVEP